jgi:hypothetical protein
MYLASQRRLRAYIQEKVSPQQPSILLDALRVTQQNANFAPNPQEAKVHYRLLRQLGQLLLTQSSPNINPLDYAETCLHLHAAETVLNQPSAALYHAKLARAIMENLEASHYPQARERFDHFLINAYISEAVAYHNLDLNKQAAEVYLQAELKIQTEVQHSLEFWKPLLYRGHMIATLGQSRFAISQMEFWTNTARKSCEHRAEPEDPLLVLLLNTSLADAYIQHKNLKKAHQVLRNEYDHLSQIPFIGALHKTMLLKSYAHLTWVEGNQDDWQYFLGKALNIAQEAGLVHQLEQIKKAYKDKGMDRLLPNPEIN